MDCPILFDKNQARQFVDFEITVYVLPPPVIDGIQHLVSFDLGVNLALRVAGVDRDEADRAVGIVLVIAPDIGQVRNLRTTLKSVALPQV